MNVKIFLLFVVDLFDKKICFIDVWHCTKYTSDSCSEKNNKLLRKSCSKNVFIRQAGEIVLKTLPNNMLPGAFPRSSKYICLTVYEWELISSSRFFILHTSSPPKYWCFITPESLLENLRIWEFWLIKER